MKLNQQPWYKRLQSLVGNPKVPKQVSEDVTQALTHASPGVLETIIEEIKDHDLNHPDHGVGCACHDRHAGKIRMLMQESKMKNKSIDNLMTVWGYVMRNTPYNIHEK